MTPGRPLGQHFLADRNILRSIADALHPESTDVVLEIGPGRGSLTRVVAPRVARVVAVEKDRRLASECGMRNAECGIDNVEVVAGDALKLNWHALLEPHLAIPHSTFGIPHFKVLGNIPYNITSPLIEKALTPPLPRCIVLLVQTEVAERAAARPGSKAYGALSVGVQAVCGVERLLAVPPGAFDPPPRVESTLVRLTPLAHPLVPPAERRRLRAFVTACFSRRRKQLRNAVMAATGRPAAPVTEGLRALGLDAAARPETLAPEAFVRLLRWSDRL